VLVWGVLCVNGLLMVEVAVEVHRRTGRTRVPVGVLAGVTLGPRCGGFLSSCYFLVVNAALTGQLSKGAFVLAHTHTHAHDAGAISRPGLAGNPGTEGGSAGAGAGTGGGARAGAVGEVGYPYWLAVLSLSGAVAAPCLLVGHAGMNRRESPFNACCPQPIPTKSMCKAISNPHFPNT
jgi:hypothetical protein